MTQENAPRFSHVVIGDNPNQEGRQSDEEVITISATTVCVGEDEGDITTAASGVVADDAPSAAAADTALHAGDKSRGSRNNSLETVNEDGCIDPSDVVEQTDDDELGLNTPMSMKQRVVLICCGIAFVIAIVLVAWQLIAN